MSGYWTRLHGDGEPSDYSAGASTEADYTAEAARPVRRLRIVEADEGPSPEEVLLRLQAADAPTDSTPALVEAPGPVLPPREAPAPIDPVTAIRLYVRHIRDKLRDDL